MNDKVILRSSPRVSLDAENRVLQKYVTKKYFVKAKTRKLGKEFWLPFRIFLLLRREKPLFFGSALEYVVGL